MGTLPKESKVLQQVPQYLKIKLNEEYYGNILLKSKTLKKIFSKDFILQLAQYAKERSLNEDEILYNVGENDDNLYFLQSGQLNIFMNKNLVPQNRKKIVKTSNKMLDPKATLTINKQEKTILFFEKDQKKIRSQLTYVKVLPGQFLDVNPFLTNSRPEYNIKGKYYAHLIYVQKKDLEFLLQNNPNEYNKLQVFREEEILQEKRITKTANISIENGIDLLTLNHFIADKQKIIEQYQLNDSYYSTKFSKYKQKQLSLKINEQKLKQVQNQLEKNLETQKMNKIPKLYDQLVDLAIGKFGLYEQHELLWKQQEIFIEEYYPLRKSMFNLYDDVQEFYYSISKKILRFWIQTTNENKQKKLQLQYKTYKMVIQKTQQKINKEIKNFQDILHLQFQYKKYCSYSIQCIIDYLGKSNPENLDLTKRQNLQEELASIELENRQVWEDLSTTWGHKIKELKTMIRKVEPFKTTNKNRRKSLKSKQLTFIKEENEKYNFWQAPNKSQDKILAKELEAEKKKETDKTFKTQYSQEYIQKDQQIQKFTQIYRQLGNYSKKDRQQLKHLKIQIIGFECVSDEEDMEFQPQVEKEKSEMEQSQNLALMNSLEREEIKKNKKKQSLMQNISNNKSLCEKYKKNTVHTLKELQNTFQTNVFDDCPSNQNLKQNKYVRRDKNSNIFNHALQDKLFIRQFNLEIRKNIAINYGFEGIYQIIQKLDHFDKVKLNALKNRNAQYENLLDIHKEFVSKRDQHYDICRECKEGLIRLPKQIYNLHNQKKFTCSFCKVQKNMEQQRCQCPKDHYNICTSCFERQFTSDFKQQKRQLILDRITKKMDKIFSDSKVYFDESIKEQKSIESMTPFLNQRRTTFDRIEDELILTQIPSIQFYKYENKENFMHYYYHQNYNKEKKVDKYKIDKSFDYIRVYEENDKHLQLNREYMNHRLIYNNAQKMLYGSFFQEKEYNQVYLVQSFKSYLSDNVFFQEDNSEIQGFLNEIAKQTNIIDDDSSDRRELEEKFYVSKIKGLDSLLNKYQDKDQLFEENNGLIMTEETLKLEKYQLKSMVNFKPYEYQTEHININIDKIDIESRFLDFKKQNAYQRVIEQYNQIVYVKITKHLESKLLDQVHKNINPQNLIKKIKDKNLKKQQDNNINQNKDVNIVHDPHSLLLNVSELLNLMSVPFKLQRGKSLLLRKKIYVDQNEEFPHIVLCGFQFFQDKKEPNFICKAYDSQHREICVEILSIDNLFEMLKMVEYRDVLPINTPLQSLSDIYLFTKYLVLPFIGVEPDSNQIKLFSKAPGIFPKGSIKEFLGQDCLIFLNPLDGYTLHLVLKSCDNPSKEIHIDLEMDKSSFQLLFQTQGENQQEIEQITHFLNLTKVPEQRRNSQNSLDLDNQVDDGNELKEVQNRVLNFQAIQEFVEEKEQKVHEEFEMQGIKIKDLDNFYQFIDVQIDFYEDFIRTEKKIQQFDNLIDFERAHSIYSKIKIYMNTKKSTIYYGEHQPFSNQVLIQLKNTHETFLYKAVKGRVAGNATISATELENIFGFQFENQSLQNQRQMINLSLDRYNLSVTEKMDSKLISKQKSTSKFNNNPILKLQLTTGRAFRTIIENQDYRLVLTMEQIGIGNTVCGIRCLLFDPETCMERGAFLTINQFQWIFDNKETYKKVHLKTETLPQSENCITHLFNRMLVPMLLQVIDFQIISLNNQEYFTFNGFLTELPNTNSLQMVRMESFFNVETFLNHFSEK